MIFENIKKKIKYLIESNKELVDKKKYKDEIEYLKGKFKNSAYKNIRENFNLKQLNQPSIEFLKKLLVELNSQKKDILDVEIKGYYDQRAKMSKSPYAILDKYLNTNMINISKVTSETLDYLNKAKKNYKYNCFACNNEINKIDKGLSFINNLFFDTSRKTSHVWNFNNDIEVCSICKLIYFCVPAGFTTMHGKGLYININTDLQKALNSNNILRVEALKFKSLNQNVTYIGLVRTIQEQSIDTLKYELSDIQVMKFKNNRYHFNILSRNILELIISSKEDLNFIIKVGYYLDEDYFSIYELVIDRLFNNQNLFTLIHRLLIFKLSSPNDCRFNNSHIKRVLNINKKFMEGMGFMNIKEKDIIKSASGSGYYLRERYREKGAVDKLNGISYRLLNSLKTNNKDMFMDTLLNCYLYAQKSVPKIFLDALKDEENFKSIGYAFVTGLIEGKENGGDNNGK